MNRGKLVYALTGGIGAGKSYVARRMETFGIKVYDCDAAAKRLMNSSETIKKRLKDLVGHDVYQIDGLNKPLLAKFLLQSDANREAINRIVHPAVAEDFLQTDTNWLESAILFDTGFNRQLNISAVVCVSAPLDIRINRIIERDHISKEQAESWISKQMNQHEVETLSDYTIINDGKQDVDNQIDYILKQIMQ